MERIQSLFLRSRRGGFAFVFLSGFLLLLLSGAGMSEVSEECEDIYCTGKIIYSDARRQGDKFCVTVKTTGICGPFLCGSEYTCPCVPVGCSIAIDEPDGNCITQDASFHAYSTYRTSCRNGVQKCNSSSARRYCNDCCPATVFTGCNCDAAINCSSYVDGSCRKLECIGGTALPSFICETHKITLGYCSDVPDSSYLPKFGDTLCFLFTSDQTETLEVELKTSTFEGIAINAPVPAGHDTISDMIPLDTCSSYNCWESQNDWRLIGHNYVGDRSVFRLQAVINAPPNPYGPSAGQKKLRVLVLDFAAELELSVTRSSDSARTVVPRVKLPLTLDSLRSTADNDNDGYTRWEEYRGFVSPGGSGGSDSLIRLTPDTAEVLYILGGSIAARNELSGMFDTLSYSNFTGAKFIKYGNSFEYTSDTLDHNPTNGMHRYFVDHMSRHKSDTSLVQNDLCTPPGMEEYPRMSNTSLSLISKADMAIVWITASSGHSPGDAYYGATLQQIHLPDDTSECGDRTLYPGPGGTSYVRLYKATIDADLDSLASRNDISISDSYLPEFKRLEMRRTLAHEIGHVLGIDHHCSQQGNDWVTTEGDWSCVMKNDITSDYPQDELSWPSWLNNGNNIGSGYSASDAYSCMSERKLRPTGAGVWP